MLRVGGPWVPVSPDSPSLRLLCQNNYQQDHLSLSKGPPRWAMNYKVTNLSTSYSNFRKPPEGPATSSQALRRLQSHKPSSV